MEKGSMFGRMGLPMMDISLKGTDKGKENGSPARKEGISIQVSTKRIRSQEKENIHGQTDVFTTVSFFSISSKHIII